MHASARTITILMIPEIAFSNARILQSSTGTKANAKSAQKSNFPGAFANVRKSSTLTGKRSNVRHVKSERSITVLASVAKDRVRNRSLAFF